jgi:hypothetical protein
MPIPWGGIAIGAGAALGGLFSSLGAKEQAGGYGEASKEQAEALREISQWGYGYPSWLVGEDTGFLELIRRAGAYEAPSMDPYIEALRGEAPERKQAIEEYITELRGLREEPYETTAPMLYAKYLRGAEETMAPGGYSFGPGRGGGRVAEYFRGAAEQTTGVELEELRRRRGEVSVLDKEILASQLIALGVDSETALKIAQAEDVPWQKEQQAMIDALGVATGIPKYGYEPPWPGIDPSTAGTASLYGSLGRTVSDLGYYYGMQSALRDDGGVTPVMTGEGTAAGSQPLIYNQSYNLDTYYPSGR